MLLIVPEKLSTSIKSYGLTSVIIGQNGNFLALKVHGVVNQICPRVNECYLFHKKNIMSPHFDQFSEQFDGRSQSYFPKKCHYWLFGALTIFFQNRRMSIFNLSEGEGKSGQLTHRHASRLKPLQ